MSWSYIISVVTLIFCCFAFLYFRMYIKKRTGFDGIIKEAREEVNRLLGAIDEITDKDISLIEDREKRLKLLLEETDKRLAVLNRELERRTTAEKTYREMGQTAGIVRNSAPAVNPPANNPPDSIPKTTDSSQPVQQAVIAAPAQPAVSAEEQIREMARAGIAPAIIASRLGISITEAEFAAALETQKNYN